MPFGTVFHLNEGLLGTDSVRGVRACACVRVVFLSGSQKLLQSVSFKRNLAHSFKYNNFWFCICLKLKNISNHHTKSHTKGYEVIALC